MLVLIRHPYIFPLGAGVARMEENRLSKASQKKHRHSQISFALFNYQGNNNARKLLGLLHGDWNYSSSTRLPVSSAFN